jgi:hypothetical protein
MPTENDGDSDDELDVDDEGVGGTAERDFSVDKFGKCSPHI